MKLSELVTSIDCKNELTNDVDIKGLAFNSSEVKKGYLFIAISGNKTDGHLYIEDAISNGASAIIGEKDISIAVPYLQVEDSRKALAHLAKAYFNDPTKGKIFVGITGTNGKTTTSYMTRHILESQGISCALFGSISIIINGEKHSSPHTTLDPLTFHQFLSESTDQVVVMEVSSHGLIQHRVEGIDFDVCVFTNIEHEHLDYHEDMEAYFEAKKSLFDHLKPNGTAVIHGMNEYGERLCTYVHSTGRNVLKINGTNPTYIINGNELTEQRGNEIVSYSLYTQMKGKHNIENAAHAFSVCKALGVIPENASYSLNTFSGLPGRYQLFSHPKGATFVVDYAHTANAFSYILDTVRNHKPKNLIHIFGFRGNRDIGKRKRMVEVSLMYSDCCILTFDDLNGVSYKEMIKELEELGNHEKCIIIPDRTTAIHYAWERASDDDWIVITGKGCEAYQQKYALPTTTEMDTLDYLLKIKTPAMERI